MISEIRRNYLREGFNRSDLTPNPISLFRNWFSEALDSEKNDPNAMALATVDNEGQPTCRIVLLKEISNDGFTFFTNYRSLKGGDIKANNKVAATFFWAELERQVRIIGRAVEISAQLSDSYFFSRPLDSQISAIVSPQSSEIDDLEEIKQRAQAIRDNKTPIERPLDWGGYLIFPHSIEFWQGGANRLHTRFEYTLEDGEWSIKQLAP